MCKCFGEESLDSDAVHIRTAVRVTYIHVSGLKSHSLVLMKCDLRGRESSPFAPL